jgi:hypothetical protein
MAHTGYVTSSNCRHTQSCGVPLLIDYDSIRNVINCISLVAYFKALTQLKEINRLIVISTLRHELWWLIQDRELGSLRSSIGRNTEFSCHQYFTQDLWPFL